MFAMLEAQVILATMVQQANLQLVVTKPVELATLVTLRPKETLLMQVEARPFTPPPTSPKNGSHLEAVP